MSHLQQRKSRQIFSYPLASQRYNFVKEFLMGQPQVKKVVDFGSGNGRIVCWIKQVPHLEEIIFVDKDNPLLEDTLYYNFKPNLVEALFGRPCSNVDLKLQVYNADLTRPSDLFLADCILLVEVIEHLEPSDVDKAVRTIFGYYEPKFVIITTPNCEFNHLLREPGEPAQAFRHDDHKFEWTRQQFHNWSQEVCDHFPYKFHMDGVGHLPGQSEPFGPCSQISIFERTTSERAPKTRQDIDIDILFNNLETKDTEKKWGYNEVQNNPVHKQEYLIPGNKKTEPSPYDKIMWSDLDDPVIAAQFAKDIDEYERRNKIGIYAVQPEDRHIGDTGYDDEESLMEADNSGVWINSDLPVWE